MTVKISFFLENKACKLYRANVPAKDIRDSLGIGNTTLYRILERNKIPRCQNRLIVDVDEIVRRYLAGESELAISRSLGIVRTVIRRRLIESGVHIRSGSEANIIRMSRLTPGERSVLAANAHAAVCGVPQSNKHRIKIAKTREINQTGVFRTERIVADKLTELGFNVICQKAVGRYNLDVAITKPPIAVEIFGGMWHAHGPHAARFQKRFKYIINSGWTVVIIWVSRDYPLESGAIDYIVSLAKRISRNKPIGSKKHMIFGNGKPSAIGKAKFKDNS
jgi:very-short-patch-repair endonuclease